MGPKRSGPRRSTKSGGVAVRCRSGYRFETPESDIRNNRWFTTKKRVVFHPPKFAYRKLEMRARIGQCVPPGQKRVARMNERLREKTYQKRLKFSKSLMSNPVVQQRLAQYKAEEEARRRAAQRAADRAPREGRTRSQNEPRRSGRLGG